MMDNVRKWLTYMVVGTWAVTALCVLVLIFTRQIDFESGLRLLTTVSGVTSGFVGVILGYYFSKS